MKLFTLLVFFGMASAAFAETEIPDYGRPNRPLAGSRQKALERCQREHPGTNCLDAISASNQTVLPADATRPGLVDEGKRQRLIKTCLKDHASGYCYDLYMAKKAPTPSVTQTAVLQTSGDGDAGQ